jgi:hypothetical protein
MLWTYSVGGFLANFVEIRFAEFYFHEVEWQRKAGGLRGGPRLIMESDFA